MPTYLFFVKKKKNVIFNLIWKIWKNIMMSKWQKLTFLGELTLQSVLQKENKKTKTQF